MPAGERALIAAFEALLANRSDRVIRCVGDDAAGWRALAAALSDIAAMGADPGEAYVAMGIPEGFGADAAAQCVRGMESLAAQTGVTICGGDVTRAPALVLAVTVVGWADDE